MKLRTILILLVVALTLFLLVRACVSYVKNGIADSFEKIMGSKEGDFFENMDLSSGKYAIVIDDQTPPVLIDDTAVLSENIRKIETDVSWMNYLPGEGGGVHGTRVFENNTLVHARLARKFKTFKVGNLRAYGRPLEYKSIYEPRTAFLKQKDSLERMANIFIARETEVDADGYDYHFTLYCPPLLVSEKDTIFNAHEYGKGFAQRIANGLSDFRGFRMSDNAANSTEPSPLLVLKESGSTYYLRDAKVNSTLPLTRYTRYGGQLIFFCTKEFYEQLQSHDFTPYFKREGLSEREIKNLIQEKIGPDNDTVQLDRVFASMFSTGFKIGKAYENKYELGYFQLVSSSD